MDRTNEQHGYYHITLLSQSLHPLLRSNSERAFIVTQLQDLLSPRLVLGDIPAYRQLASCIDLLAFSIQRVSAQFVVFSISEAVAHHFTQLLCSRLAEFQTTHQFETQIVLRTTVKQLRGPHHALTQTVAIHALHDDWEYDRYSSIGFYLHDRRGDWMRVWRMANLYEHNTECYRALLTHHKDKVHVVTPQSRVA